MLLYKNHTVKEVISSILINVLFNLFKNNMTQFKFAIYYIRYTTVMSWTTKLNTCNDSWLNASMHKRIL